MELLSVIRRWHYRDHYSIREISRRTGLSRNTVRKYLRSDSEEPKFSIPDRPSKLDPHADKLSHMLRQEAGKSRKQKRTIKQLHADMVVLGYEGSYNRVAAFARDWRAARQREQKTAGRGVFVPLAFMAGEAFQFDWSEDWAVIAGERTKLQVAHFKLSCSRAFFLRAYPQQTHEMLFDAHNHAFRVLGVETIALRGKVLSLQGAGPSLGMDCCEAANGVSLVHSALARVVRAARKKCSSGASDGTASPNVEGYDRGSLLRETIMSNVVYRTTSEHSVRHLDVAPMISALRFQPVDFEFAHGWLRHVPSRHRFQFDRAGRVAVDAVCGCAGLSVSAEQADELHTMFQTWRQSYWQPLETNREFASHFRSPNPWVRLLRDVRMAWRRFRRQADSVTVPLEGLSATPAE